MKATLQRTQPFVDKNVPIVGSRQRCYVPFICKNKPYIGTTHYSGVTLVELLVTLVIAGILVGLAAPQFSEMVRSSYLSGQANDLIADLNFTRSESIKRGGNVGLCAGNVTSGCTGTWTSGRVMFVDTNGNGAWDAASDSVIRSREALDGSTTLNTSIYNSATNAVVAGSPTIVVYGGAGATTLTTGYVLRFALCRGGVASRGKLVTARSTGQVSVSSTAPTSC